MSLDLNTILKDWPHQNGSIKVRKIVGLDGREKLQLRIDLGVLQMEVKGRPDGVRPYGCESLLDYHQRRATISEGKGEEYELNPEQCAELQQEGIQYYHRYLSLFQINDFAGVVRDTQRNLDLFDFVAEHTDRDELAWTLQQFRPYVLMMNTRAKASIFLAQGRFPDAISGNRDWSRCDRRFLHQIELSGTGSTQLGDQFSQRMARRSESETSAFQARDHATGDGNGVAKELYERAAELRDAIRSLEAQAH